MSDSNQPYQSPQENDEVPVFCQNCSAGKRKIGYYLTLGVGAFLYIMAIIHFFGSVFGGNLSYMYAIFACLITLLCPLWMKSFSKVFSGLREPSRKMAFFALIISFIGLIVFGILGVKFFSLLFIFGLILSGLWLSLTYYQKGQETILQYLKRCFGRIKGDNNYINRNNDNNV